MVPRPVLPVPPWLIVADIVAALLLASGLLVHFDPALAGRMGLPEGAGIALIVSGGLGLLACAAAIVGHVVRRRGAQSPFPH